MHGAALFTWRDIERALSLLTDPPWVSASAGPDAISILCRAGQECMANEVIRTEFGARASEEGIRLESLPDSHRVLPVHIETLTEPAPVRRKVVRPLWPDAHLVEPESLRVSDKVRVAAFFSYKGGVGRTTCLLATAGALLQRPAPPRMLVVDADLEAPGLTWNLPGPPDRISLLDALALIHDEDDWKQTAIPLIVSRLLQNQESFELPSGRASFFFLPAFRDFNQIFSLPISFDQLVRARGRAHIVGDTLIALGESLKVDAVLIDLRAGITDFSSPLLLDGRIQSILVTSCSRQSVDGTVETLSKMRGRIQTPTSPEVVISLIPPGEPDSLVGEITEKILAVLPPSEEEIALSRGIHQVGFAQELLHFDSVEELLARRVPGTELGKRVAPQLAGLLLPVEEPSPKDIPDEAPKPGLTSVFEEAKKLEFAESSGVQELLPTASLTSLVEHFSLTLPAAVVLGSKGAGKTFAWMQMVARGSWQDFRRIVSPGAVQGGDSLIFPLLGPLNPDQALSNLVDQTERRVREALTTGGLGISMDELRTRLESAENDLPEAADLFWSQAIADRLGLPEDGRGGVEHMAQALASRGRSIILVVDGFEDAFQISPERPLQGAQRRLLRTLLQKIVPQIRDLASPALGAVIFVRRDLAEESIPQNFGQFEALYSKFNLIWSPTEALRLAAWLVDRGGRSVMLRSEIPMASYDQLMSALRSFWGVRMGSEKSKEAYTDRWVIAALSDLQGRLQPRDMVRLIRFAAEKDQRAERLSPQSLRSALADCSAAKIKELEQEVRALKAVFDKLRHAENDKKAIPFSPEDFELNESEVTFLKRQGIVTSLGEGAELYMPEIIRQGLNFRLKEGRRAKVIALYRAAQLRNL
jgi:MinD-like ATPase involved in chromosome partitioning or flagellar assembly